MLDYHAKRLGLNLVFDSAGTANYHTGEPPDSRTIYHAKQRGYDLSGLRARQIKPSDFKSFDLILAADEQNLSDLRRQCPPEYHHKLKLFLVHQPLPDPYYGEAADFEKVLDLVEKQAEIWLHSWSQASP